LVQQKEQNKILLFYKDTKCDRMISCNIVANNSTTKRARCRPRRAHTATKKKTKSSTSWPCDVWFVFWYLSWSSIWRESFQAGTHLFLVVKTSHIEHFPWVTRKQMHIHKL